MTPLLADPAFLTSGAFYGDFPWGSPPWLNSPLEACAGVLDCTLRSVAWLSINATTDTCYFYGTAFGLVPIL